MVFQVISGTGFGVTLAKGHVLVGTCVCVLLYVRCDYIFLLGVVPLVSLHTSSPLSTHQSPSWHAFSFFKSEKIYSNITWNALFDPKLRHKVPPARAIMRVWLEVRSSLRNCVSHRELCAKLWISGSQPAPNKRHARKSQRKPHFRCFDPFSLRKMPKAGRSVAFLAPTPLGRLLWAGTWKKRVRRAKKSARHEKAPRASALSVFLSTHGSAFAFSHGKFGPPRRKLGWRRPLSVSRSAAP